MNTRSGMRAVAVCVLLIAMAACGAPQAKSAGHGAAGHVTVDGARHKAYASIKSLATDSTAILIAKASSQAAETDHGVPFATTTMTVVSVVRGYAPSTFRLRQLGSAGSAETPVAQPGSTYLLFLQPFELQHGVPVAADLFVTVGASSGMFQQQGSTFRKTDPDAQDLPAAVTLADVRAATAAGTA